MKPLGEAASELPWLMPSPASLIALTQPQPPWDLVRRDPGALLLVLRATAACAGGPDALPTVLPSSHFSPSAGYTDPPENGTPTNVLKTALTLMSQCQDRAVVWSEPGPARIYRQTLEYAALAQTLAARLPRADAGRAWIAGLLAPLGWLAICAAAPARIAQQLREFTRCGHQAGWQHLTWGLDHAALVRRLCRVWQLPSWLANVVGHVGLPVDVAVRLGAEPVLFQTLQLALALRQRDEPGLALPVGAQVEDLLTSLDLSSSEVERTIAASRELSKPDDTMWQAPKKRRLLTDLLRLASEKSLAAGCQEEGSDRLQVQKMTALAELAAGAGHEINNPLAVISGQAQYIARQLEQAQSLIPEEPVLAEYLTTLQEGIQRSLMTIRGQSQRIHNVLTDLMQFARPSPPQPRVVSVRELLRETIASVQDLALVKKVRLVCPETPDGWRLKIDPTQTRAALTCLLRNAVEAAPAEGAGWAGVRAAKAGESRLMLLVEDNGPGLAPQAQEHMFDPFFSGRSAGRGQGLGLPIAWRLARQQGGEVAFAGRMDGITRFTLSLPGLEAGTETDKNGHPCECSRSNCAA